jgi:glycosyltransferase involved in cell wall biosynthesis
VTHGERHGEPDFGPSVSAGICTRDRPLKLVRALESLHRQSIALREVVVVDNAPTEDERTHALVRESFPEAIYVHEPRPGLDVARNTMLRTARGDLVAFLDDDAVADPDWARALRDTFRDGSVGACTGRVEALALETDAQRLFEANGGFSRGADRVRLPDDAGRRLHGLSAPLIAWALSVGSGCSLAVRRKRALELGGFDEALDRGRPLPGGGDLDFLWRVLQAGHRVVYEPGAVAWHEHRREMREVSEQLAGHQLAVVAFLTKCVRQAPAGDRTVLASYLAWRLLKPGARLARRALGKDPLPAGMLARMWWSCWKGLLAYPR